jgi:hypothetical protein
VAGAVELPWRVHRLIFAQATMSRRRGDEA